MNRACVDTIAPLDAQTPAGGDSALQQGYTAAWQSTTAQQQRVSPRKEEEPTHKDISCLYKHFSGSHQSALQHSVIILD